MGCPSCIVVVVVVVKANFELKGDCPVGIRAGEGEFSRGATETRAAGESGMTVRRAAEGRGAGEL